MPYIAAVTFGFSIRLISIAPDNVGGKFPEEARKMHYGEIEHRSIYGVASPEEAQDLSEEGIDDKARLVRGDSIATLR